MPRRRSTNSSVHWPSNGGPTAGMPIVDTRHTESALMGMLADLLDPPKPKIVIEQEQEEWTPPPDIVEWTHYNFIDPTTAKLVMLQGHQQRLLRTILDMIWKHQVVTVVWSEIKKSGKTSIAGLMGAYWSTFIESPNVVITVANDQEQAKGRIYDAMGPTMKKMGWDVPDQKPVMTNTLTGSIIQAIGTNYAGEAGGNYGLTLWSELWAYRSEARKRLWEEMTPVPTRRFSVRWVETYAGFKNESDLLWTLYTRAFKDGEESKPLGEKIPGLEDLPVWYLPTSKMIVYWSHEPRMPWQTPEYYEQQQADLRPNAFRRLHRNEWVSSVDAFITSDQWDVLERCDTLNEEGDSRSLVLGADASTHGDCTALVAATWNAERKAPDIVACWIWYPEKMEGQEKPTVDLSATIGATITTLLDEYNVAAVLFDPMQLHSIMVDLQKSYDKTGLKKLFVEFGQNQPRVMSDTYFYQMIRERKLHHYGGVGLRQHVLNAVAEDTGHGIRLDKEKTTAKIDAAVASAMAVYGCSNKTKPRKIFVHA
jgi:hypothetical protein